MRLDRTQASPPSLQSILVDSRSAPAVSLVDLHVEPHLHLDKAYSLADQGDLGGRPTSLGAARSQWHSIRNGSDADSYRQRAVRVCEELIEGGVRRLEAQVDARLPEAAIASLVEGVASLPIEVTYTWIPSMPVTGTTPNLLGARGCLKNWGGSLGGAPQFDDAPVNACRALITTAENLGVPLNLHIDEHYGERAPSVLLWIMRNHPRGFSIPLTVAHVTSIAALSVRDFDELLLWLLETRTAVVCLPQTHVYFGLSGGYYERILRLAAAGVKVLVGTDNIGDPFNPDGRLGVVETLAALERCLLIARKE